uniref:Uncharacterized protein n=1 Tax=Solanum lycopersicum TaxID=4081 RepID=K4BAK1_SOLLC
MEGVLYMGKLDSIDQESNSGESVKCNSSLKFHHEIHRASMLPFSSRGTNLEVRLGYINVIDGGNEALKNPNFEMKNGYAIRDLCSWGKRKFRKLGMGFRGYG